MKRIFVVAGEASGDMYAGAVISALKARNQHLNIQGWGGEAMRKAGAEVLKDYHDMAFMGFAEVLSNLGTIRQNFAKVQAHLEDFQPDLLLTVDFPGFNLRLARWARRHNIPTAHYISPAIWAWKPGRIRKIQRDVNHMFVTLPFEKDLYDQAGVPCTFVGHPLLDAMAPDDVDVLHDFPEHQPLVALLPGSRKQEIEKMLPVMLQTVAQMSDVQPVVAAAPGASDDWYTEARLNKVEVVKGKTRELLRRARAGLVTSGTATLEAGLAGLPTIVCYKTSAITFALAKRLARVSHIGLPNIILNDSVFPERIQSECHPDQLMQDLTLLIQDPPTLERNRMLEKLKLLHAALGSSGAAKRVAQQILQMIGCLGIIFASLTGEAWGQSPEPALRVGLNGGAVMSGWKIRVPEVSYQRLNAQGEVLDTLDSGVWLSLTASADWLSGSETYAFLRPLDMRGRIELKPPDGASQLHPGALHLDNRQGKGFRVILETQMERYLPGVLSAETGKGHAPSFYEAQAIVSRTYTTRSQHRHRLEGFHVCDQVHCQVYHGITTCTPDMYQAVSRTRNKILIDEQGVPITAAFHSNCGGHTQGAEAVWQVALPYLRCIRDTFCARGVHSHWEREISGHDWRTWLSDQRGGNEHGPSSMFPRERAPHLLDSTAAIRAAAARSAFDLPSAFFVAMDHGSHVELVGQGFGHGIGMCQEGAMARAQDGASCWDILSAYFQGVHLADGLAAWRLTQKLGK